MTENDVVGFIDILGYKSLVDKFSEEKDIIRDLEEIIVASSVGLFDKFKNNVIMPENYQSFYDEIFKLFNVRFISDTILFTAEISKINNLDDDLEPDDIEWRIQASLYMYFSVISLFCTYFIAKTGFILRGGIALGRHYERQIESSSDNISSLFIFSKAYNRAYYLEQKALLARIIIDKELSLYIEGLNFEKLNNCFYIDPNIDEKCLDIYSFFENKSEFKTNLADIKKGVEANIKMNKSDGKALEKLFHFASYHNTWTKKENYHGEELKIRTDWK